MQHRYWLMKLDVIANNNNYELADPKGFGTIEFAYSRISAGVEMTECRLSDEGGRRHFMTSRFDCLANGETLHMQPLAAFGARCKAVVSEVAETIAQWRVIAMNVGLPPGSVDSLEANLRLDLR